MTQLFGRLMSRRREFLIDALHIFVLAGFAVAQPLPRDPEAPDRPVGPYQPGEPAGHGGGVHQLLPLPPLPRGYQERDADRPALRSPVRNLRAKERQEQCSKPIQGGTEA